jgi:4-alpha-glucanotransferase
VTAEFEERALVRCALARLGVARLALGCFDASFPSEPDEDVAHGSPYGRGAARFFAWARDRGFGVVQMGPQGETSPVNPSPYDGALFVRSTLSLALAPLVEQGWLSAAGMDRLVRRARQTPREAPHRAAPEVARPRIEEAIDEALRALDAPDDRGAERRRRLAGFEAHHPWLERQALYAAACAEHGDAFLDVVRGPRGDTVELDRHLFDPRAGEQWRALARRDDLTRRHPDAIRRFVLAQHLIRGQHEQLRARLHADGLALYGDLQIGVSVRDRWAYAPLFLARYAMGAPPSRTTPAGQAWGYPVLDPALYGEPCTTREGPALAFVRARLEDALGAYDGVRIDHPHGHVDPWVYAMSAEDVAGEPGDRDPLVAVRAGARLFGAPDLPDHPALAALAIARPEQLDRAHARWDDGWVRALSDAQVTRYAAALAVMIDVLRAHGRDPRALAVEVLSTLPYPLGRALARFGLGRFRITQKASADDPRDAYRSEHAEPPDWIMIGNHDTEPIWALVDRWAAEGAHDARARRLADRIAPAGADDAARAALARSLAADPRALAAAHAAELFTSRAESVLVFVGDLLGWRAPFNVPGTVSPQNWSQRVPPDFEASYRTMRAEGTAIDLRRALATALRARGGEESNALAARLDALAAQG